VSKINDKDIVMFFTMMIAFFGHRFKSSYGSSLDENNNISTTAKIWLTTLNEIPNIKEVVEDFFKSKSPLFQSKEWCPDLREVATILKELSNEYENNKNKNTPKIETDIHNVHLSEMYVSFYKGGKGDKETYEWHKQNIERNKK